MIGPWAQRVFLSGAQRRLFRRGLPILMFHKLAAPPAATLDPFDYTRPESLDARLGALRRSGLQPASLDRLAEGPWPAAGLFIVTFDDGYRNVLEKGLAILARHQVQAIQFLVAGRLGGRNEWDVAKGEVAEDLMDASQVREWLAAGHQIGSHSLTHRILKKLSPAEAREEIAGSKKRLEDLFGVPVRHFCYPSGRYHAGVCDLVREAGYQTACTVKFGVNPPGSPPMELRRIATLSAGELLAKICHRLRRKVSK